jgi:hypothetical protein
MHRRKSGLSDQAFIDCTWTIERTIKHPGSHAAENPDNKKAGKAGFFIFTASRFCHQNL